MDATTSFGQWLRQRRRALGLTHATLANGAHCSVSALRKIEQDERHPSHRLAERLAVCLQIPSAERACFLEIARGERRVDRLIEMSPVSLPPLPATSLDPDTRAAISDSQRLRRLPAYNLPRQLTSFVGRERELGELRRLLGVTRLLTLTGAGGSGKTRLALQFAAESVDAYKDGICFVDLAALDDPALVTQTAASAVGLAEDPGRSPAELLVEHLRSRTLLLVIDNCEHLIAACAALAESLLGTSPGLRILATSRESLGVAGEIAWPVPSLSTPDLRRRPARAVATALDAYEAVRLFVDRALLSQPAFALTDANAPAVAKICGQLEGIPLAVELAAARVKVMSVEQIAARLTDRFALLTSGRRTAVARHRTLRAAIDWSYDHLVDSERTLFRRLSVFSGAWSLEAAESVGAGAGIERAQVLDLLSHLVDKSLVIVEPGIGGEAHYRLLVTLREYAGGLLDDAGDVAPTRDRHLDWCLAFAERAEVELRGPDPREWLDRLEQEHDNLRTALAWSRASETRIDAGLRLAGSLCLFWGQRGHAREGLQWLDAALVERRNAVPGPRALALHAAGSLAWRLGDHPRARALLEESLCLRRELAVPLDLIRTLGMLGVVLSAQAGADNLDRARACFEESLPLARRIGDVTMIAHSLNALGEIARMLGHLGDAQEFYTRALEVSRGSYAREAVILLNLGLVAFAQGNADAARAYFEQSLALYETLGERGSLAACLDGLAGVHAVNGEAERAAQLLGAAEALRAAIGEPVQPTDRIDYERFVAAARSRLDEASFTAAWSAGARLTPEEAIALALA